MLKQDADVSDDYNGKNWAFQIKDILQRHGLANIWIGQFDREIHFNTIKQRILDMYFQSWYAEIDNSSQLQAYSIFRHNFEFQDYLDNVIDSKYRTALARFRTSSHKLAIESGRFENIMVENRKCRLCTMNTLENEYHFLLVCPFYRDIRIKYLPSYFCSWPTLNKFESIMSSKSKYVQQKLAKFIYFASKNVIKIK